MNYPKIYDFIRSHSWAITPEYMNTMLAVLNGHGDKLLAMQMSQVSRSSRRTRRSTGAMWR